MFLIDDIVNAATDIFGAIKQDIRADKQQQFEQEMQFNTVNTQNAQEYSLATAENVQNFNTRLGTQFSSGSTTKYAVAAAVVLITGISIIILLKDK